MKDNNFVKPIEEILNLEVSLIVGVVQKYSIISHIWQIVHSLNCIREGLLPTGLPHQPFSLNQPSGLIESQNCDVHGLETGDFWLKTVLF